MLQKVATLARRALRGLRRVNPTRSARKPAAGGGPTVAQTTTLHAKSPDDWGDEEMVAFREKVEEAVEEAGAEALRRSKQLTPRPPRHVYHRCQTERPEMKSYIGGEYDPDDEYDAIRFACAAARAEAVVGGDEPGKWLTAENPMEAER